MGSPVVLFYDRFCLVISMTQGSVRVKKDLAIFRRFFGDFFAIPVLCNFFAIPQKLILCSKQSFVTAIIKDNRSISRPVVGLTALSNMFW